MLKLLPEPPADPALSRDSYPRGYAHWSDGAWGDCQQQTVSPWTDGEIEQGGVPERPGSQGEVMLQASSFPQHASPMFHVRTVPFEQLSASANHL